MFSPKLNKTNFANRRRLNIQIHNKTITKVAMNLSIGNKANTSEKIQPGRRRKASKIS